MTRHVLFAVSLATAFVAGCGSCESVDDEAAIRALIEKGARLAEQRNIGELMDLATGGFQAHPGPRDRRATKGVLFVAFRRYGQFTIEYPSPSVSVDGARARASMWFVVARQGNDVPGLGDLAGDPTGWLEKARDIADPYRLELSLEKDGGDWLVSSATIDGLGGL